MEQGWLHVPYRERVALDAAPLRHFLIRWGHSLAWMVLAVPAYLAFLTATFVLR